MKLRLLAITCCSLIAIVFLPSCGGDPSFSLTSEETGFTQVANQIANVDILWVVDNSGSMADSQADLATNFNIFITNFTAKNFNYQIGVVGSDAWLGLPFASGHPSYDTDLLHFRDGGIFPDGPDPGFLPDETHSGVFVVNNDTVDPINTFITNATLGVMGSGDERIFSSMKGALEDGFNTGFVRSNSFLAVIILSDEDDWSHSATNMYTGVETLDTVASYKTFLDSVSSNYSVSTINVPTGDSACLTAKGGATRYGTRYEELADLTGGDKISICSNFATSLDELADHIVQASLITVFEINREPIVSTLNITVDGVSVPMSDGSSDGWEYSNPSSGDYAGKHIISFVGASVPNAGASINISFDPAQFDD